MLSSIKPSLLLLALATMGAQARVGHARRGQQTRGAGHAFTFVNKCGAPITPVIADTSCGYSPRCADAAKFSSAQPGALAPGASTVVTVDSAWVGRVFASHPQCGPKGEGCTITEFNLDSGDSFTPQTYDISNIQGFTDAVQVGAAGCDTVTCSSPSCGCTNAYPLGDISGCGNDSPVRACGAGGVAFTVTFCP
ncbi:hypothetical protein B0H10DRAFT_2014890 [Mycena sp. CBHHK59/15]|nr:hypothetical protein B0H10DRAFT_2014890 [Mycena sp. CBHHK59/15]